MERNVYLQSLCITRHAQWAIVKSAPDLDCLAGFAREFQTQPNRSIGSDTPQPQQRSEPARSSPADESLDNRGGSERTGDAPDQTSWTSLTQRKRLGDVGPYESRQGGEWDEAVSEVDGVDAQVVRGRRGGI